MRIGIFPSYPGIGIIFLLVMDGGHGAVSHVFGTREIFLKRKPVAA